MKTPEISSVSFGTNRHHVSRVIPLVLVFVLVAGCYKPSKPVAALGLPRLIARSADIPLNRAAEATKPDEIPLRWTDIKDHPFGKRADFMAGLARLREKVDAQVAELTAKRASMLDLSVDTKEWDFNMKEMNAARSYFNAVSDELRKATPETWDQGKEKAGQAWVRTQEAYDKVKSSTTS